VSDEEKWEALPAEGSKPKKGKERANVTCWNCKVTGHYLNECNEPKKMTKR
jgi:hypothetical protein